MFEQSSRTVTCANTCNIAEERSCHNCAKGRITGYNHQNQPLYTCPMRRDHLSCEECKEHQSYEEKYGCRC